ncbi:MAG: NAD(P)/FAD-dependent oxidoreductase [Bacilli bacterium]|nr:NAD(P)/FAD-dependent oxidoreductase [Bacilli bacterium]
MYDIAIIGAGVVGSSIAYVLSHYELKVVLLDKENDVSTKTSKANSGIIHAGYDPKPGTKMARLNVMGNALIRELAPKLNIHFTQCGSLVVGSTEEDHRIIDSLYERGLANGVPDMKVIKGREEVHALEPNLAPEIDYALFAGSAGVIAPWELTYALALNAVTNGGKFIGDAEVKGIKKEDGLFRLETSKGIIEAKYVINAAGLNSDEVNNAIEGETKFTITPCKGEYYLLDKSQGNLASHVIFQTPTKMGKGVLVSPTCHGNLIVGPDANLNVKYREDVSNSAAGLKFVRDASARSVPSIPFYENIRNFAGERATIAEMDDFLIGERNDVPGFINFAGIKSPGLTCGPAFGYEAVEILKGMGVDLIEKKDYKLIPLPKYFKELSKEEQAEMIKNDPNYGQVICRCETITLGEIIAAIHAPIPARSIDGVKRRTNAGMGRCQGGFCGPKVFAILMKEAGLNYKEVYQDLTGSSIAVEETKGGSR